MQPQSDSSAPHVMCDIETLGTGVDAAVVSIGAVRFDPDTGEVQEHSAFHAKITLEEGIGKVDIDTVCWWMQQSDEARSLFLPNVSKVSLRDALKAFRLWLEASPVEGLWSNGPTFDEAILRHASDRLGVAFGASFRSSRCMRTAVHFAREFLLDLTEPKREGTKYDALADAIYQAQVVCEIHRQLQDRMRT